MQVAISACRSFSSRAFLSYSSCVIRQRHRGGIKVEHLARHSPAIRGGGRLAFQLSEITLQECGIDARRHDPSRSEIPLPPLFIERIINGSPRTGIS